MRLHILLSGMKIAKHFMGKTSSGPVFAGLCKGWIQINPPCQRTSCTSQERVASDEAN